MFTGIIEEIGKIRNIRKGSSSSRLTIHGPFVLNNTKIGDSIAVNGVCLTVTRIDNDDFQVDIMAETLRRSNLGELNMGDLVNLERALSLNQRLGGHIVSGHIDGTGEIISMKKEDNAVWITIGTSMDILRYVIYKGSIAIDGISLTIAHVDEKAFKVSIIPHTGATTTLLKKSQGDMVNLECDIIGKYVEKLLLSDNLKDKKNVAILKDKNTIIDENFLKANGFF